MVLRGYSVFKGKRSILGGVRGYLVKVIVMLVFYIVVRLFILFILFVSCELDGIGFGILFYFFYFMRSSFWRRES